MFCAKTHLILLVRVMIIIMNDNKNENDDLMKVLCAHTFLMMMDCTLSWFHKTPFIKLHKCCTEYIACRAHTCTMYEGCKLQKKLHITWLHTADNCTVRMALRCTKLHSIESKIAGAKNIFTRFIRSRFPFGQTN